jgi:hypothetical protein
MGIFKYDSRYVWLSALEGLSAFDPWKGKQDFI